MSTQISRRRITTGAAWSVPVILVGAMAPVASASATCSPNLEVVPEKSSKCCNGKVKNMKVTVKATDTAGCATQPGGVDLLTILSAKLDNSGTAGDIVIDGKTIYLLDTTNCTVNLFVTFMFKGQVFVKPVTSNNIPSGNSDGD